MKKFADLIMIGKRLKDWPLMGMEKTLMLGKIEGRKRRGRQRMRWLDSIISSMDMSLSKLQETVDREDRCAAIHRVAKNQTWLSNSKHWLLWLEERGKLVVLRETFQSLWLEMVMISLVRLCILVPKVA